MGMGVPLVCVRALREQAKGSSNMGVLDIEGAEHPQKIIMGANSTSAPTESMLLDRHKICQSYQCLCCIAMVHE